MDILYNVTVKRALYKLLSFICNNEIEEADTKEAYDTVVKALENDKHKAFVPYSIKSLEKSIHEQIENIGECSKVQDVNFFLSEYQKMADSLQREVNSFADFMRHNYCEDYKEE